MATSFLFYIERQKNRARRTDTEQPANGLFTVGARRVSTIEGPPAVLVCASQSPHVTLRHPPERSAYDPHFTDEEVEARRG